MDNITTVLRENGLKATPKRIYIYNYLINTTSHPSAEEIYNQTLLEFNNVSFATVYKTLKNFKEKNLIREIKVSENFSRYDATISTHPHFICKNCKNIFDISFKKTSTDMINNIIVQDVDYEVESLEMYLFGTCKNCK